MIAESNKNNNKNKEYNNSINNNTKSKSEYEETILFFHHIDSYSIVKHSSVIYSRLKEIPFLLSQEYVFTPLKNIKDDNNISSMKLSSSELLQYVVTRVKQFTDNNSDISIKSAFIENLMIYIEKIGIKNTSYYLMPCLSKIVNENNELISLFLNKCFDMIDYFKDKEELGYKIIKNNFINILNELYYNRKLEISIYNLIFDIYRKIINILSKEDVKNIFVSKIIDSVNECSNIKEILTLHSNKIIIYIFAIIKELVYKLDIDINQKYILPQIVLLSSIDNINIRTMICDSLIYLSNNIRNKDIENKLNPIIHLFSNLKDDKKLSYKIRIKLVNVIYEVLKAVQKNNINTSDNYIIKNSFYIVIYKNLILDQNKEVSIEAFSVLGKFIDLLNINEIDNFYINVYTSVVDEYFYNKKNKGLSVNDKILYPSAYNLSFILLRYGTKCWNKLKNIFFNLCQENNPEINAILVNDLSNICNILGKDNNEEDFFKDFEKLLKKK